VEAQWETLTKQEKIDTALQLEELQKKDWKELSLDEKKASMLIAFWAVFKQLTWWP
jgi:cytochrome c oxidase subunit 4